MPITVSLLIIQVCCMASMKILGVAYDYDSLTLVFIVLISVAMVMESSTVMKDKNLHTIFLMGLVLRLGLLFCDYYVVRIMHSGLDTESFFNNALNGNPDSFASYFRWLTDFFMFVGPARLFAQYINLVCGLFSCLLILKALRLLKINVKAQKVCFMLLCLLPNWADMSVILLRESLISLFVSLSLLLFIIWYQSGKIKFIYAAILLAIPAVDLHGGMIFLPIAIMAGCIMYNAKRRKMRLNVMTLIMLILSLTTVLYVIINYGLPKLGNISLDNITRMSGYAVTGRIYAGSVYLQNLSTNSWRDVFIHTPIRLIYFFFSPLPMDFRGVFDLIAFVFNSFPIFFIISYAIYTLFICDKNRNLLLFLLMVLVFGGIVYAWGTFAAGTAMRHRDKLTPLYVLIMAVALDARAKIRIYKLLPSVATNIIDRYSVSGHLKTG